MTNEELADLRMLRLANSTSGKFALEVVYVGTPEFQLALERGMSEDWFRLIDVSPVVAYPNRLFRVFLLTACGQQRKLFLEQCALDDVGETS